MRVFYSFLPFFLFMQSAIGVPVSKQPIRNITGSGTPFVVPSDASQAFKIIIRGQHFGTSATQPSDLMCRVKIPDFEAALAGPTGPARVINDTAIECTLSGYLTYGEYGIAVESASHSDPSKHSWWSSGTAAVQFRNLIEATPDKRPYMNDEIKQAELLVAINIGAIRVFPETSAFKTFKICGELTSNRSAVNDNGPNPYLSSDAVLDPSLEGLPLLPCRTLELPNVTSGADMGDDLGHDGLYDTSILSLEFDASALSKLHKSIPAANIKISITLGEDYTLLSKYRRFSIAPSSGVLKGQSTTVVCHKRRMVRVNGEPWVGVGFYVAETIGYADSKHNFIATPEIAKQTIHELAREGMSQIMPYGLDAVSAEVRADIVSFMDKNLSSKVMFDMPLVADVVGLLNSTIGSQNYTEHWNNIKSKVASVRHSPSLLGYYICDDCNNAGSFPPKKMALFYEALKNLDPYHITIGAPWMAPWSIYQYGDDAGALSLDYPQVENYHPDPAYHRNRDERARAGMFWEPIANSPPMYILTGFTDDARNATEPWPPILEYTLSWLGAIQFGAVSFL